MSDYTPEQLEEAVHLALTAGDIKAVNGLLRMLAVVDPGRAEVLFEQLKVALALRADQESS
ncbi:MAG: hypothetical protein ABI903_17270 [Actinomycetota bacterium]